MTVNLLQQFVNHEVAPDLALVVGIGGFPFTGKTTLAQAWVRSWRGSAVHLPTESTILSRVVRDKRSLDGCAAEAHDLTHLREMIVSLRRGLRVVVPHYEWYAGARAGADVCSIERGGLIVVDGSVVCEPEIAELCDRLVFVMPQSPGWLEDAVDRDVHDRFWSAKESRHLNAQKTATVVEQYRRHKDHIDLVIGCFAGPLGEEIVHHEIPPSVVDEHLADMLSASKCHANDLTSRPYARAVASIH